MAFTFMCAVICISVCTMVCGGCHFHLCALLYLNAFNIVVLFFKMLFGV